MNHLKHAEVPIKTIREWIVFAGGTPVAFDNPTGEDANYSPATIGTASRFPDQAAAALRAAPLLARGHVVNIAEENADVQSLCQEAKEKRTIFNRPASAPKPKEFIVVVDGAAVQFCDREGTDFESADRINATTFADAVSAFRRAESLLALSHSVAVEELVRDKEFIVFAGGQPVRFLNDGGRGMAFELTDQAGATKFSTAMSAQQRGYNLSIKGHLVCVGELGCDGEKLFEEARRSELAFKQSLREPSRQLGALEASRKGFAY